MDDPAEIDTVVLHPVHSPGLPDLLALEPGVDVILPMDDDAVAEALAGGMRVLLTYRWDDRFLTDGLRWIQAISAGMDQFPAEEIAARGIVLTSARGAHAPAVAEHAIALLMAVVRQIGPAVRGAAERAWYPTVAHEVGGLTLGVLGLGSIGEEVARRAVGLGMRVIGTKQSPSGYAGVAERVVGPEGSLEVCREADAVVIALPQAEDTARIVGSPELEALRDGWLVNIGRGSVVDESALIEALRDGTLRGAGLDVFATEPLPPDSPLWDLPNVVITPHVAWATDRLPARLVEVFRANRRAYHGEGAWATRVV
jgi:phosphoglycerate dehydrogenase-like enzyme